MTGTGDEQARQSLRQGVVVVLVRPLQSGNVGSAARAMKNMGLRRLAIVAPPALDIDRARWMAPGAEEILDQACFVGTVADAVADCRFVVAATARKRHSPWPALDPQAVARVCLDGPGPVAILFGPEDHGLANDEVAQAHALVHIPTDAHASINVAQAVLLTATAIFAEATNRGFIPRVEGTGKRGGQKRGAAPGASPGHEHAPLGELDPLVREWLTTVERGGYMAGHEPVLVEGTMRRILQRARLSAGEISIVRGQLRKVRWKMEHP